MRLAVRDGRADMLPRDSALARLQYQLQLPFIHARISSAIQKYVYLYELQRPCRQVGFSPPDLGTLSFP